MPRRVAEPEPGHPAGPAPDSARDLGAERPKPGPAGAAATAVIETPAIWRDPSPLDPYHCGDSDGDGCEDCARPEVSVIDAAFTGGADGFSYVDDAFRGTSAPGYAGGSYVFAGGFSGGGLRITLGNVDAAVGKIVSYGLTRMQSPGRREDFDAAMEEGMMEIVPRLEKRTHYIATFANVITLVGLLGAGRVGRPASGAGRAAVTGRGDHAPRRPAGRTAVARRTGVRPCCLRLRVVRPRRQRLQPARRRAAA